MAGIWVSTVIVTFWVVLGSWVGVFPDTLEKLFGVGYGFKDSWGVDRTIRVSDARDAGGDRPRRHDRLLGAAGVRRQTVPVEIGAGLAPEGAA